ncbi:IS1380 family transposase [Egibacter rhizosphaerae]|uniref:IS1380 family transposase n=1 Tax=Egibacter rhizosphaerae TaxID=1670831 RepID=A0A411YH64_9ACTN|nr:IS1380 family transposase [Egibacter rhizosphaerae]
MAGLLRPGNAGSNTAAAHICLLDAALAGLPEQCDDREVVVRGDAGYATKALLAHAREQGCGFSVTFEVTEAVKHAIRGLDEHAWEPAIRQDHTLREGAAVTELTDTVDLPEGWPTASRLIIRREPLHPGAQQTISDLDGCRFTALLTDQPDSDIAVLEQRHRARARAEDRIRTLKDLGMGNLPCDDYQRNAVWLQLALLALNLTTWTQALTLDGELARAEPKRLRYQLLHVAARLVRSGRRTTLRLAADWPWTPQLVAAFQRLRPTSRTRLTPRPRDL